MFAKAFAVLSVFLLVFAAATAGYPKDDNPAPKKDTISVEILHCNQCGYRSRAIELAEELKKEFGIEAALTEGDPGSFNVFVNGELIFSKYEEGRFPNPGEIVQKIKEYMKK
jgi:selenoprotein W-related protein